MNVFLKFQNLSARDDLIMKRYENYSKHRQYLFGKSCTKLMHSNIPPDAKKFQRMIKTSNTIIRIGNRLLKDIHRIRKDVNKTLGQIRELLDEEIDCPVVIDLLHQNLHEIEELDKINDGNYRIISTHMIQRIENEMKENTERLEFLEAYRERLKNWELGHRS